MNILVLWLHADGDTSVIEKLQRRLTWTHVEKHDSINP